MENNLLLFVLLAICSVYCGMHLLFTMNKIFRNTLGNCQRDDFNTLDRQFEDPPCLYDFLRYCNQYTERDCIDPAVQKYSHIMCQTRCRTVDYAGLHFCVQMDFFNIPL